MSGRDSSLNGFNRKSTCFSSSRIYALNDHMRELSGLLRIVFELRVPDSVVYNALVLFSDFMRNIKHPSSSSDNAIYFAVSIRFSIFHRQRLDILSHLQVINKSGRQQAMINKVNRAEIDILKFSNCRIWFEKGNVFEELGMLFDHVFASDPGADKLRNTSTRLCWMLLGSGRIVRSSVTTNIIYPTVLVCSVEILSKSPDLEGITNDLLELLSEKMDFNLVEVRNLTDDLLSYILH
jgi:hypothetical protein